MPLTDQLKQTSATQAFVAHTPRFITAKEKLNSPARKRFELRHNIVRRDCAKHDGWSYTITDRFYHLLYLYNKSLISRRIGDDGMLFFRHWFCQTYRLCFKNI